MTIPRWVERYRNIAFDPKEVSREKCKCWGIPYFVLLDQCGIEVDPHYDISADDVFASVRAFQVGAAAKDTWIKVQKDEIRAFDLVLMTGIATKLVRHVGIMVSPSHVLHIEERGLFCEPITDRLVAKRIRTFHRHVALA